MSIKSFIHKIKMGFIRKRENSLPYVSPAKKYGNIGEFKFVNLLRHALPMCKIKQNVLIDTMDGNAEIDCLILYHNKIFAIEVKHWKGRLIEKDYGFIQEKTDRWTGEKHIKSQRSPFKQLNRAVYLLKNMIPSAVWINSVVFFDDDEFEGVDTLSSNVWFDDIEQLTQYIINDGRTSTTTIAEKFFEKCIAADYLYSKSWEKSLLCIIENDSLKFQTVNGEITREDIHSIHIEHHWSYDNLNITLKDRTTCCIAIENAKVTVRDNGMIHIYGMSKLDYIELGEYQS